MNDYNWTKNVYFHPWVGENYKFALKKNRRLLLLGNSHYFTEGTEPVKGKRRQFTNQEVKCAVKRGSDKYTPHYFYRRLQDFLASSITPSCYTSERFINVDPLENVSFYNYLQIEYVEAREKRTAKHYRDSEPGFYEVLAKLEPTHILVCGRETWNFMNEKNPVMTKIDSANWKSEDSDVYSVVAPCKCLLASTVHPSYSKWYEFEPDSKNTLQSLLSL